MTYDMASQDAILERSCGGFYSILSGDLSNCVRIRLK